MDESRAPQRAAFLFGCAEACTRGGSEVGDRVRMPQRVRRLHVGEVGDGQQRRVALVFGEHDGKRWLCIDDRSPGAHLVKAVEQLLGVPAQHRHQRGIELRT